MRVMFDGSEIPIRSRLDEWLSTTANSLVPTEIAVPQQEAFNARLAAMALGTTQVASLSYTSLSSRRSPKTIRVLDPEYYQIALIRAGQQGIEQHHTSSVLRPGELTVYDSSEPFEAVNTSEMPAARSLILQLPKYLLPLPAGQVRRICAAPIPGATGIGRLLTQFLISVTENHAQYTGRDIERLGRTAIDLTAAMLAHQLEQKDPPIRSPSYLLYLRIVSFIDQHLHRPDLSPAVIATAHRISLRYLHRIFQLHHHTSVNTHIRAQRLSRIRRDLIDPRLSHLAIASIAARWGFSRPADFSRAFRQHTGVLPSDCRSGSTPSRHRPG